MNQEEKIYALMACAEDHQKLIDESIQEFKNANKYELGRLALEQQKRHSEHRMLMNDMLKVAKDTGSYNFRRLGLMWFFQTLLASVLVVVLSVGGVLWFMDHQADEIVQMNQRIKELSQKGGDADVQRCRRDNGKVHPCVRVMTKWGGFGEDSDMYIIAPK